MRTIKIVADSAANITHLDRADFALAPLKIRTTEKEFVDDAALDVADMLKHFDSYSGRSFTSCPNPGDWLDAFDDAEDVFCVTITGGLSGSYNAACTAKEMYESENPGRRVFVLDSLSAGPEIALMVLKLEELVSSGMPAEEIDTAIRAYAANTGLLFMLESLKNFAANGRVPVTVARLAGVLGIRVVGRASEKGQLDPLHKCRGEANALSTLLKELKSAGLYKGKVQISHCCNEKAANTLRDMIESSVPLAKVTISACRGLCSYYAEKGGLLIGFEKQ